MVCLICKKKLEFAFPKDNSTKLTPNDSIMDGGTVEISFGYGSLNDCKSALGHICDDCFEKNYDCFVNHTNGLN